MNRCLTWNIETESWFLNQFPDLSQFIDPEPFECRGEEARSPGRILLHCQKVVLLVFLPAFPKLTYSLLPGWLCTERKKKKEWGFLEILDTGSELTLIAGDPKKALWPTRHSRDLWKWNDHWSFSSSPFHSVTSRSPNPSCGYFLGTGKHNWNRKTQQLQNPHIGSPTCGLRAIMVRKAKWKPLELPLSRKIVNQKQCCIPGEIAEIIATMKDVKDAGVVIPTTSPFKEPIWPVQKTDRP